MMIYELTLDADLDLNEIFHYTRSHFGFDQAERYLMGFNDIFSLLVQNPEAGRERPEYKSGLRSFVHKSHTVFYKILPDRIVILRIVSGSRDLEKIFSIIPLASISIADI